MRLTIFDFPPDDEETKDWRESIRDALVALAVGSAYAYYVHVEGIELLVEEEGFGMPNLRPIPQSSLANLKRLPA